MEVFILKCGWNLKMLWKLSLAGKLYASLSFQNEKENIADFDICHVLVIRAQKCRLLMNTKQMFLLCC